MRHPAAKGRADSNQRAIADAIRLLGFPVMDLSHAGNGVEDLLVGLRRGYPSWRQIPERGIMQAITGYDRWWTLVEVKVARNKRKEVTSSQLTPAQKAWRELTAGWPRLTVTSAQDAVDRISELTR